MKILVVSQYPLSASTTNRMLGFAIGLEKRGHKVTLLILGNKHPPGIPKKALPNEIDGVKIRYTPSLPKSMVLMPSLFSGFLAFSLILFLKFPICFFLALFHDVIYSSKPLPYGATVTLLASLISRKPYVLDTDDWEGVGGFATIKQGNRAFIKAAITYFEEKVPTMSDAIVTASELLSKRIILSGVKKDSVFIVPNGADLFRFHPNIDGSKIREKFNLHGKVFSYLGTFKRGGANWQMLLESFKFASSERSDMMLFIIGFGEDLETVKSSVDKIGLKEKVVFTGEIEHEKVPEYLAAADIFLLPYQDDFPNTFINIGRSSVKLYEYMAMGKAIIATEVGEVGRALRDGAGFLVKTNDAIEFGKTMLSTLESQSDLFRAGKKARDKAENIYNYNALSAHVEKALTWAINC